METKPREPSVQHLNNQLFMGQKNKILLFFNTWTLRMRGRVRGISHWGYHFPIHCCKRYSEGSNTGQVIQIYSDVAGIWVSNMWTLTVFYFMSKYKSITSDLIRWILTNSLFTRSHSACEHLRSSARTRSDPWTRSSLCWNVRPELSLRTSRATRPEAVAS